MRYILLWIFAMLTITGCKGEEKHVTPKSDTCTAEVVVKEMNGAQTAQGKETNGAQRAQGINSLDSAQNKEQIRALEQQCEIDRQRAYKRYAAMLACLIGLLAIMGLLLAWYAARQWHKTQLKNRVLAQQIKDAMIYREQNEELKRQIEALEAAAVPPSPPPFNRRERKADRLSGV